MARFWVSITMAMVLALTALAAMTEDRLTAMPVSPASETPARPARPAAETPSDRDSRRSYEKRNQRSSTGAVPTPHEVASGSFPAGAVALLDSRAGDSAGDHRPSPDTAINATTSPAEALEPLLGADFRQSTDSAVAKPIQLVASRGRAAAQRGVARMAIPRELKNPVGRHHARLRNPIVRRLART